MTDVPVSWVDTNPLLLELPRTGSLDNGGQRVVSKRCFPRRSRRITRNRKRGSKSPARAIWIWLSTGTSSLLRVPRPREAKNYRTWPPPRRARLRSTSTAGRVAKNRDTPDKANGSPFQSVELSGPTTSVTGSREGQNIIVASVRSEHIPASLYVNGFIVKRRQDRSLFHQCQLASGRSAEFRTGRCAKVRD